MPEKSLEWNLFDIDIDFDLNFFGKQSKENLSTKNYIVSSQKNRPTHTEEQRRDDKQKRPKKERRRLTSAETTLLTNFYAKCPHPNAGDRQNLAMLLDMTPRTIQIWFQNKRAKIKREKKAGPAAVYPPLAIQEIKTPELRTEKSRFNEKYSSLLVYLKDFE
eukprot:GHVN01007512.1.p2 GENE.GHVN01007512.1~~GHVN01007512.1.p2  ORF type:complete len:162 (+),score=17.90 GHVN01007512.1:2-487(+)